MSRVALPLVASVVRFNGQAIGYFIGTRYVRWPTVGPYWLSRLMRTYR